MIKKNKIILPLVAVGILLLGAAYYWHRSSSALPTASTNTTVAGKPTILLGTIQSIQGTVLTLSLRQGGTVNIIVSSSTVITKNVLQDAKTLAAAFKEYQDLKAKAGGKPFTPPSPANTVHLSLGDLKAGLSVMVTPEVYSTTDATAVSILVVPTLTGATPPTSTN